MRKTIYILLLSFLCGSWTTPPGDRELVLRIKPVFGNKRLMMNGEKYSNAAGDTLSIELLRFYISSVKVFFDNGSVYTEKDSYHLVDIQDSVCPEIKLAGVPQGKISRLEFYVGIDSLTSVSGAYGGDLDPVNGMYWSWNSGYINAKMEGTSRSCHTLHQAFEFHIGGYLPGENALRKVILQPGKPAENLLVLRADAAAWFRGVRLTELNSVVIPGKEAMRIADNYSSMFSIEEN